MAGSFGRGRLTADSNNSITNNDSPPSIVIKEGGLFNKAGGGAGIFVLGW